MSELASTGFATQTPTDPVTNRLTSPNVYDASGNLTNDTLHTYTYDAENRIKTVDSTAATYTGACPERSRRNGGPLRVKEVVSGATVVRIYSGSKLIAYYVNGALSAEYVYAGNTQLAQVSGATRIYSHPDHLSNRVLTNQSGGVEWTGGHYPFGESWYQPTGNTPWRFTTYLRVWESGLDYAIFRDYSSRLGRFMQQDLLAGTIEDPQSLDGYSYVLDDPVNEVDPLGLDADAVPVVIPQGCNRLGNIVVCPLINDCIRDVSVHCSLANTGVNAYQVCDVVDREDGTATLGNCRNIPFDPLWRQRARLRRISAAPGFKKQFCLKQADMAFLEALLPGLGHALGGDYRPIAAKAAKEGAEEWGLKVAGGTSVLYTVRSWFGVPMTLSSKLLKGAGYLGSAYTAYSALKASRDAYKACMEQ